MSVQRIFITIVIFLAGVDAAQAVNGHRACPAPPAWTDPGLRARLGSVPLEPPATPRAVPSTTGNVHLLVVLAEFADEPHRIEPARFQELLFGPGAPGLADYYDEVSSGQLSLTGELVGWVPLPQTQFFYSQGVGGVGGYPNNGQKLAEDAVLSAVAGSGLDLRDFDADGDGIVDALLVIHSGQGFEWAGLTGQQALSTEPDPEAINSHKWVVRQSALQAGAPLVTDYFTCPELQLVRSVVAPAWSDSIATIGVFAHEFGHVLGLPDFYDTQTLGNHVGVWDIMDYGTWSRADTNSEPPGATPSHFSAWSKMFLGWVDPVPLAPPVGEELAQNVSLTSATLGGSPLQALANPFGIDWSQSGPGTGEYFVAEHRTRTGYDVGLPGEGLLVYHVDESRPDNSGFNNPGDARLITLEPRDGKTNLSPASEVATELWPGGGETAFDATSDPSSDLHDGSVSGVGFSSITATGGGIDFLASVSSLTSQVPVPFARPNPWHPAAHGPVRLVVSLEETASTGPLHIHDIGGRRVRTLPVSEFTFDGRVATWDGRTDAGNPASAGTYFLRVEGSSAAAGKIVLVRR